VCGAARRATPAFTAGGWASPAAARRWFAGSSGPGASNAYVVLGVERGLSDREYKVAYIKIAKTSHPDMNPGDEDATARFQVQPTLEVTQGQILSQSPTDATSSR